MDPDQDDRAPVTLIGPAFGVIARLGMAWLEQPSGERRYVESELRIGRGEQNDLRLNDASVSRYHAFLRRVDGRYLLSDVGSQNGTFVNGERVTGERPLHNHDQIQIGNTRLVFRDPDSRPRNARIRSWPCSIEVRRCDVPGARSPWCR